MKRKAGVTAHKKADIDKDKFQDYLQNEIVESYEDEEMKTGMATRAFF